MKGTEFDDIRPYYDCEIPAAMHRIVASEYFPELSLYVYPDKDIEDVRNMVRGFKTTREFQLEAMRAVNEQVIARSISDFSFSGIEHIDKNKRYLFISNHRDIMLDSCLLQYVLYKNGHETSEITFGSNLMCNDLIVDIGKSNKMFRVERSGKSKDFYSSMCHLSKYIRYVINDKKQSVWIAQRNGRTKDGNDFTSQNIIKMFGLSMPQDKITALEELNILPVSISYEWEPCDLSKALETYESHFIKYVKKPGEDLVSILTGILQQKGKVHIEFCEQVTSNDLIRFSSCKLNDYNKMVARLIDQRILSRYKLYPNNFIAHDLLHDQEIYTDKYTSDEKDAFVKHLECLDRYDVSDRNMLRAIFIGIYANPVDNILKSKQL